MLGRTHTHSKGYQPSPQRMSRAERKYNVMGTAWVPVSVAVYLPPRIVLDSASPYSVLIESPKGSLWARIWTHSFVHAQVSWEVSVSRRRKFHVGITGQRIGPSTLQGCTCCGWKHCAECLLSITQLGGSWTTGNPSLLGLDDLQSWACALQNSFWLWMKTCPQPSDAHQSPSYMEGQCWRAKELRNGLGIAQRKIGICHNPDTQCVPTLRKPSKWGQTPSLLYEHSCGSWKGLKHNVFYSPISVMPPFSSLYWHIISFDASSQEFTVATVKKINKSEVNTDMTSRGHLTFQWSCRDLLPCLTGH